MKFRHFLIVAVLAALLPAYICAGGCFQTDTWEKANPWTHLNFNNRPENFQFVIVSDRTGGARPGIFADAVRKINLLLPEFVICIGDLIEGYTDDDDELVRQWKQFDDLVGKLEMPFFYVAGNHDIANDVMLAKWKQRLDRPYYHFLYHDVLFLCLDTEGGFSKHKKDHISDEQIEYFRDVLDKNRRAGWTLVFMHKPLWEDDNPSWNKFEKLLADRDYTVFAGHKHQYARSFRRGRSYIRLATTGGASTLDGPTVGTFDHIVWVTMTDHGPRIANLMLDGIYDENVTPYVIAVMAKSIKKKLDQGSIIQFDPIVVSGDVFAGGKTKMKIVNFAAFPMKVSGTFVTASGLAVKPATVNTTLLPLLGKVVDVEITVDKPVKLDQLRPIEFDGQISYEFAGRGPIATKVPARIVIRKQQNKPTETDR